MAVKSRTELLFEAYLGERGISFEYEPFGSGETNPDYRFEKDGVRVLVEVKELEETPFDKALRTGLERHGEHISFSLDPRDFHNILRRRIDSASKQLKPHENDADCLLILLGKKDPGYQEISTDVLFYTMYGDIYLSFPMDPNTGIAGEAQSCLKVDGALRKNRPGTGAMYSPHQYISAVGTVQEFNPRSEYERKFYEDLYEKPENRALSAEEGFKMITNAWEKHQKDIPAEFADPNHVSYRVILVANPLSNKILPTGLFAASTDQVLFPKIITE